MKLSFATVVVVLVVLFSTASALWSTSCQKRSEVCRSADDCCTAMGHRIVCAPHLEICGKKTCCITEVEEQQEKQAAIIRNRNRKSKRIWNLLMKRKNNQS